MVDILFKNCNSIDRQNKKNKNDQYLIRRGNHNLRVNCQIMFFNKKGLFGKNILHNRDLFKYINLIEKSKMVVIKVDMNHRAEILSELQDVCNLCNCFGPIVNVGENDIYFFPKLNYGDAFLIKNIFEEKFINEKVSVIVGEQVI